MLVVPLKPTPTLSRNYLLFHFWFANNNKWMEVNNTDNDTRRSLAKARGYFYLLCPYVYLYIINETKAEWCFSSNVFVFS